MLEMKQGRAFEIKELGGEGTLVGYGAVFGNVDAGDDVVDKGAFLNSLETRGIPKMLWSHDFWEPPIGKWLTAKEDDHGLLLHGQLNMNMQRGAEVHAALKMETLDGLSIGYLEKVAETGKGGVRHLKELDLFEVSVVTFPMNELARVESVKDLVVANDMSKRALATVLRDAGFSRSQAEGLVARGWDGLDQSESGEDDEDVAASAIILNLFK